MALLDDDEVARRLERLEGWERAGQAIRRQFRLQDFAGSVDFVNRIAPIAEEMGHHPDLELSWNRVTVSLSTHSEGGLTERDFALAERIDAAA